MNLHFTIEASKPDGTIFRFGIGGHVLALAMTVIELLVRFN